MPKKKLLVTSQNTWDSSGLLWRVKLNLGELVDAPNCILRARATSQSVHKNQNYDDMHKTSLIHETSDLNHLARFWVKAWKGREEGRRVN